MKHQNLSGLLFVGLLAACGSGADVQGGAAQLTGSGYACMADADCPAGEECDDGLCRTHHDTGSGAACTADSDCAGGEECEHGACQAHGGNRGGDDDATDDHGRGGDDDGTDDHGRGGDDDGTDDHGQGGDDDGQACDDDGAGTGSGAACTVDADCAGGSGYRQR
ncbi:MAG: hypothetical protein KC933_37240 [Myxococcales bacterium]|nr:hypothetical protein [Myxococcales bacterium]